MDRFGQDNPLEHPAQVCSACRVTIDKAYQKKRPLPENFSVTSFPKVRILTRGRFECEDDCEVCTEANRYGFLPTLGKKPSSVGKEVPVTYRSFPVHLH